MTTEWNQPSFVLGLVRSHWDEKPPFSPKALPRREWLNRGIASITPINGVMEVLEYPIFKAQRKRDAATARRARSAILD